MIGHQVSAPLDFDVKSLEQCQRGDEEGKKQMGGIWMGLKESQRRCLKESSLSKMDDGRGHGEKTERKKWVWHKL